MIESLARAGDAGLSDFDVVRRVRDGDKDAFETLMRRHNRTLFRTARAILRDDAEAEDALQEAYLQAYRMIGSFRGQARLSTWLARIVANEALMRLRKHTRREGIVPLRRGLAEGEMAEMAHADLRQGPETSAQRAEIARLLEQRIDALPAAYRSVFVLRGVEEYSVEETATILGIPEATVRSRFFRARSLLREGLASEVDLAYESAFPFAGERCDRIVAAVMTRLA
jgi:RNA polymerase sigma-70 factor (ECF subfamily)